LLLFALLVAALWDRLKAYGRAQLVAAPQKVTTKQLTGDDLTDQQRQLLIMLWRLYPKHIGLRTLLQNFQLTYPALERLVESVEKHGLVEIVPGLYHAKSVFMTKVGRDFCHDNGLAVDH
jgi:DNA-binding MarR family transcriptional regulator